MTDIQPATAEPIKRRRPAKLIRAANIIEDGICENRQGIYRKIATEGFPKPIQLGPRSVAWYADEVECWLKSRPRADPKSARAA